MQRNARGATARTAIRLDETKTRTRRDPQLRGFAAGTLPMPNAHPAAVRRLAQALATAH